MVEENEKKKGGKIRINNEVLRRRICRIVFGMNEKPKKNANGGVAYLLL